MRWPDLARARPAIVTRTPDGRVVLRLEDNTTRGAWLELLAGDVDWLAAVLDWVRETARAGNEG